MRILNYLSIFFVLLSILIVSSCADSELEHNDSEIPEISNIRFNVGDTVIMGNGEIITLNRLDKDPSLSDTLVIGHKVRFRGEFTDNHGLSSVYVRIWGDTVSVNTDDEGNIVRVDTCYRLRIKPVLPIQGEKILAIEDVLLGSDEVPVSVNAKDGKRLLIREGGTEEPYEFSIWCSDLAGNENKTAYERTPIVVSSRKTIIEHYKKVNGIE